MGVPPWGSVPCSFTPPCPFCGVHRGPESGVEAVAEGPLEGGLPLVLALETGERSAAGVEELGRGFDGGVAAEVEAADEEGQNGWFSVRNGGVDVRVSGGFAGVEDMLVEASAGKRHGGDGSAEFIFEGEARGFELFFEGGVVAVG